MSAKQKSHTTSNSTRPEPQANDKTSHTRTATLTISQQFPSCWEDENTLRWGFEQPLARIHRPSTTMGEIIRQLSGQDEALPLLTPVAKTTEAAERNRETQRVIKLLQAVLETTSTDSAENDQKEDTQIGIALSPANRVTPELIAVLTAGNKLKIQSAKQADCALLIRLEYFLEPPALNPLWQDSETPQLYIRFTDTQIHIGPVLRLPGGPCHGCLVTHLLDKDPAITTLAAQLIGTTPHTALHAPWHQLTALIKHFANLTQENPTVAAKRQISLKQEEHGMWETTTQTVQPHPQCGCHTQQ